MNYSWLIGLKLIYRINRRRFYRCVSPVFNFCFDSKKDRNDRSQFRCVISNMAGTDSTTFNVDVLTKPEILGPKDTQTIIKTAGDLVTLTCDVSGVPLPEIEWFKDGSKLYNQPGSIQISSDARHLTLGPFSNSRL